LHVGFLFVLVGFLIVIVILFVVLDGGECAEEQAADVGKDGSAARGDAAFGEEDVESAEGVVDALGPLKIVSVPSERLAEVRRRSLGVCGVTRAEAGGTS
jgi:hypothetical protein